MTSEVTSSGRSGWTLLVDLLATAAEDRSLWGLVESGMEWSGSLSEQIWVVNHSFQSERTSIRRVDCPQEIYTRIQWPETSMGRRYEHSSQVSEQENFNHMRDGWESVEGYSSIELVSQTR